MKNLIKFVKRTVAFLGGLLLILAHIVGIGVVIYSWGAKGLLLSTSLWIGFKVWILTLIGGVILLTFSVLLSDFNRRHYSGS